MSSPTRPVRSGSPATRGLVAALIAAAISVALLAGCGATHTSAPHHRRTTSPRTVMPLAQRLENATAFAGFHGILLPSVIRSAAAWEADLGLVGPQSQQQTATLKRLGFLAGTYQTLYGQDRNSAEIISLVEHFRSSAGSKGKVARAPAQPRGPGVQPALPVHPFPVAAIPGAVGNQTAGPFASSRSVAFAAGPFYYQVVVITPRAGGEGLTRAQLIAACAELYRRLREPVTA